MATPARPEKRRRITAASAAAAIPDDLLIEILARLTVESLRSCTSVCRAWRAAVTSPALVRRNLELSRSRATAMPPALLVVPREGYHYDDDAKSSEISFHRLLLGAARAPGAADVAPLFEKRWPGGIAHAIAAAHCDGLVAVATATDDIFVCNPATGEFVALPPGTRDARGGVRPPAAALGYDPSRNAYVIARHFYRRYEVSTHAVTGARSLEFDIGHELFTLGGGVSWEATADPPHAIGGGRPICTRGAFYWCTSELRPNALLRFSLQERAFTVVPCPPGTDFNDAIDNLTELGGKLCYVHTATATAFEVWVADEGPAPEWTLRCRLDFYDYGPGVGSEVFLPVADSGDQMLVLADDKIYNYEEGLKVIREVVDMEEELEFERVDGSAYDEGLLVHHAVPYVESLVSISRRNY